LRPTQPSIPGLFLRGLSDLGVKLIIYLHLVPRSRMELYFHSPTRLHDIVKIYTIRAVQHNNISEGTTK
jgi:hypothetical protein